ncbi:hypothetical protein KEJ45_02735 [Candidatus Bathyarchaeota archaeon]|nr:hypothetical protein [Candidatus Bathyarchaeota archaeon]
MTKKRKTVEETAVTEPLAFESTSTDDLKTSLDEVKGYDGVIGYILRNTSSAAIDLKDPTKLIEYAILSSSAIEAGEELSKIFNLGDTEHIIVEGNNAKILSLTIGDNKISIFMEKKADAEKVLKRLRRF